jgi:hypothetical protein
VAAAYRHFFLIAFCCFLGACGSAPKSAGREQVGWRPIVKFSGRGDVQTDSFNIDAGQWRIKWKTSNEDSPGTGTFRLTVHSAISGRPMMDAVDHKGLGADTVIVNEDPRLYHLVIDSKGVDWSIAIEEAVVGIPVDSR